MRGGALATVVGTNPAANTEWSETVPAGEWWEVLCVNVVLVQGATQTPQPRLVLDDGTNVFFGAFGSTTAQAASTTQRYTWAPNLPTSGNIGATTNVHSTAPLPARCILGPGFRLNSGTTVGIGANSDYAAPVFLIVRYGTDPSGWLT
jgi:hypothetical protein